MADQGAVRQELTEVEAAAIVESARPVVAASKVEASGPTGSGPATRSTETGKDAIANNTDFFVAKGIRRTPFKGLDGFYDVAPLLRDPAKFAEVIHMWTQRFSSEEIDVVAGLDARGFLFGPSIAGILNVPFEMIRKKGKLPLATEGPEYVKEYEEAHGPDQICCQTDVLGPGVRVLLVDDVIATGGTMEAAIVLLKSVGAIPVAASCLAAIPDLGAQAKFPDVPIFSLLDPEIILKAQGELDTRGPLFTIRAQLRAQLALGNRDSVSEGEVATTVTATVTAGAAATAAATAANTAGAAAGGGRGGGDKLRKQPTEAEKEEGKN